MSLSQRFFFLFSFPLLLLSSCASTSTDLQIPKQSEKLTQYIDLQKQKLKSDPENASLHYQLANAYLEQKNYVLAEQSAQIASQLEPLEGVYFEILGDITFRTKRFGEANHFYLNALRVKPELLSVYVKLGLTYEKIGNLDAGIASLEEALRKNPREVEALYQMARLAFLVGQYDKAQQNIYKMLQLEPENIAANLLQAQIHTVERRFYAANLIIDHLLEIAPSPPIYVEKIRLLYLEQRWEELEKWYNLTHEKRTPSFQEQFIYLSLLMKQKKFSKAKQLLSRLHQQQPNNVDVLLLQSKLHIEQQQWNQATSILSKVVALDDRNAMGYFLQALVFYQSQNLLQGDLALERSLELQPNHLGIQALFLRRQINQGHWKTSQATLEQLLEKYPTDLSLLEIQADLWTLQGKYLEAEKLIRQIMLLEDSQRIQFMLARSLYYQKKYQSVIGITQSLEENWEAIYLTAISMQQLREFAQAQAHVKQLLNQQTYQGFLYYLMGVLSLHENQIVEAKTWFKKGLLQFPGQIYLLDGLSTVLMLQNEWLEAKNVLLGNIGQQTQFQVLWSHRLFVIAHYLGDTNTMQTSLQRYHQQITPTRSTMLNTEQQLLFPMAWPVLQTLEDRSIQNFNLK